MRAARLSVPFALLACLLLPTTASAAGRVTQHTWHGDQIRLYPALAKGFDGRGVTVAVLDGWVSTSHPDFTGRAVASADCTSGTCTTTIGKDSCGSQHGTHVAGTIASSSYGVAPRARLLAVRVLASDSRGDCAGDPTEVAAGIRWAVAHGARVINLSLGPDVPGQANAISPAVRDAAAAGVVVVFSAGNRNLPLAQAYGNDALVVAATGPSGALADYSQYGQGVSVAAPGGQPNSAEQCSQASCITSLYPGNRYAVAAGTSMAAPHVAGMAALLIQQRPTRSRADIISRITSTAHPLAGAGAGRVDVTAALGITSARPSPRPTATRTNSPRPSPSATPTRTSVRSVSSPSPLVVTPSPSPAAVTTSPTPSPLATSPPPAIIEPPTTLAANDDDIPVPLAGLAGALVGLAATSVLFLALGRRPN